jgi:GT2 family glycosyltransferase
VAIRVSVVVVTWNERERIARLFPSLLAELQPGDELIVSDNGSSDGTPELVRELAPEAIVVENGANLGFPGACNTGAAVATGDLLVLLNPDTVVAPGWAEGIRRPLAERRGWACWQALVTMDGGRRVNSDGGVVHFTGIAWAGHMGDPIDVAGTEPAEVGFASGACLALELGTWRRIGGMPAHFFLYCDDVDISMTLRLEGGRIGIEPSARVDHEYEFSRRGVKWRMLERNRWATVLRNYPAGLLVALMPALLATELGLLVIATASGWGGQKLLAIGDVMRSLPTVLRERRAIQARRTISNAEFARWMTPELTSAYLPDAARSRVLGALLRGYWRVVRGVLGPGKTPKP